MSALWFFAGSISTFWFCWHFLWPHPYQPNKLEGANGFCPQCGAAKEDGYKLCQRCTRLEWVAAKEGYHG